MSVTREVHRQLRSSSALTFWISEELSTAVNRVPLSVAVSPTCTLGQETVTP